MSAPRFAPDRIGVVHLVTWVSEFGPAALGLCKHRFDLHQPPVAARPDPDEYCLGCLGAEQRQAQLDTNAAPKRDGTGD